MPSAQSPWPIRAVSLAAALAVALGVSAAAAPPGSAGPPGISDSGTADNGAAAGSPDEGGDASGEDTSASGEGGDAGGEDTSASGADDHASAANGGAETSVADGAGSGAASESDRDPASATEVPDDDSAADDAVDTTEGASALDLGAAAPTALGLPEGWHVAHVGVGGNGEVILDEAAGTVRFNQEGPDGKTTNDKIADSEDGFWFYYTQVDPREVNWTLEATFHIEDGESKDGQSGFGLIAVDAIAPGDTSARYMNSVGSMSARYKRTVEDATQTINGVPGMRVVTGYTDGPTDPGEPGQRSMAQSRAFDPMWREAEVAATGTPRFVTGDEFDFTLRQSNTGYHAGVTFADGASYEEIVWDTDHELLQQQDEGVIYVGLLTARKISTTASDIAFSTISPADDDPAIPHPITQIEPVVTTDGAATTPHLAIDVPATTNFHGSVRVVDANGNTVGGPVDVERNARVLIPTDLVAGENALSLVATPAPEQDWLGEYEALASYEDVTTRVPVTVRSFGLPGQSLHAAPSGTPTGNGTPEDPLDVHTAVGFAQPGQQVILAGGTYALTEAVHIPRGRGGTAAEPIVLMSAPGERAVLDAANSPSGGFVILGDHWHVFDLEVKNTLSTGKAVQVSGSHNVLERIESHHNQVTGIQISAPGGDTPRELWPSHNLVVSSVSRHNADPGANDADGFGAKLTVGPGNVIRSSIAHHNIDDGWDLYAKSTTGSIDPVRIEDSVAYANGWVYLEGEAVWGDDVEYWEALRGRTGEGNGFKLGGESMPGAHVVVNSVSYGNLGNGVTSNSGPDPRVEAVTIYDSAGANLRLYTNTATETDFAIEGVLSFEPGAEDSVTALGQESYQVGTAANYLNGVLLPHPTAVAAARDAVSAPGSEQLPAAVTPSWFESLDTSIVPAVAADGSIDMGGLLVLTAQVPDGVGARLAPNSEPTIIDPLPPVGSEPEPTPEPTDEPSVEPTGSTPDPSTPDPSAPGTSTPDPSTPGTASGGGSLSETGITGLAYPAGAALVLLLAGLALRRRRHAHEASASGTTTERP